jgi:hypothetical protein
MHVAPAIRQIKSRYRSLAPLMDERMRRQWAGTEAQTYGWGGLSALSSATEMSCNTIQKGLAELAVRKKNRKAVVDSCLGRKGGGRIRLTESDPGLLEALEQWVTPTSRGDPMSPLRWTCKSTARLTEELTRQAHPIGPWTVGSLLKAAGDSLQSNRKPSVGGSHPDRNAQFGHINMMVQRFQQRGQPVISVDTKKKELIGQFKNGGREWQPKGEPEEVDVHDFPDPELGKAIPACST